MDKELLQLQVTDLQNTIAGLPAKKAIADKQHELRCAAFAKQVTDLQAKITEIEAAEAAIVAG